MGIMVKIEIKCDAGTEAILTYRTDGTVYETIVLQNSEQHEMLVHDDRRLEITERSK